MVSSGSTEETTGYSSDVGNTYSPTGMPLILSKSSLGTVSPPYLGPMRNMLTGTLDKIMANRII